MQKEIPNLIKTMRPNTETRLTAMEFYEPGLNRQINIREMGGVEAFNDFMEHLSQARELKREEWTKEAITDLESLMCGHHIARNSEDNSKISGSLSGRNVETLLYRKERKSAVDLKIGRAQKAIRDFPRQVKNEKDLWEKQYKEKKTE